MHVHPSLGVPLQLSSLPWSHESNCLGMMLPTHAVPHCPDTHVCCPLRQLPTALPQGCVVPFVQAQPSSITPLQFSSLPAHDSTVLGRTAPWHAPHSPPLAATKTAQVL